VLHQPARGYRVNLDAILLAAFAATARPRRPPVPGSPPFPLAADLGSATGAVALLLRRAGLVGRCLCVEAEPELAELARANIRANDLADALEPLTADLRGPLPPDWLARCDLVVANPPYLALAAGRASPDPLRAAARHELRGGLPEFIAAAVRLLRPDGTLTLIHRWRRRAFVRDVLARAGFRTVRERRHLARAGSTPLTFCVEARPAAPGTGSSAPELEEELVVHEPGRRFSEPVDRFLDGDYVSVRRSASSGTAPDRTTR